MPAGARETDPLTTGHGCDGITTIRPGTTTGNTANVYFNGLGVSCTNDPITTHTIPSGPACVPHDTITGAGSTTVFINNKPVNRIADPADGGVILGGSGNVFVG